MIILLISIFTVFWIIVGIILKLIDPENTGMCLLSSTRDRLDEAFTKLYKEIDSEKKEKRRMMHKRYNPTKFDNISHKHHG